MAENDPPNRGHNAQLTGSGPSSSSGYDAWYSMTADQMFGHLIYLTQDGQPVKVTQVSADRNSFYGFTISNILDQLVLMFHLDVPMCSGALRRPAYL